MDIHFDYNDPMPEHGVEISYEIPEKKIPTDYWQNENCKIEIFEQGHGIGFRYKVVVSNLGNKKEAEEILSDLVSKQLTCESKEENDCHRFN
jgi:hypothetical protein